MKNITQSTNVDGKLKMEITMINLIVSITNSELRVNTDHLKYKRWDQVPRSEHPLFTRSKHTIQKPSCFYKRSLYFFLHQYFTIVHSGKLRVLHTLQSFFKTITYMYNRPIDNKVFFIFKTTSQNSKPTFHSTEPIIQKTRSVGRALVSNLIQYGHYLHLLSIIKSFLFDTGW